MKQRCLQWLAGEWLLNSPNMIDVIIGKLCLCPRTHYRTLSSGIAIGIHGFQNMVV